MPTKVNLLSFADDLQRKANKLVSSNTGDTRSLLHVANVSPILGEAAEEVAHATRSPSVRTASLVPV